MSTTVEKIKEVAEDFETLMNTMNRLIALAVEGLDRKTTMRRREEIRVALQEYLDSV